jgi:hypothetical protein
MIEFTMSRCMNGLAALVLPLLSRPLEAQGATLSDSALRAVALEVAALDMRRQLAGASAATIDSLLAYYSDSVVYEHPSIGAVVRGKAALRSGMLRFIGSVSSATSDTPRVVVGARVALLEMPARPDPRAPTQPVPPQRRALRLLEFDSYGRICRILDYPW